MKDSLAVQIAKLKAFDQEIARIDKEWPDLSGAPDDVKAERAALCAGRSYLKAIRRGHTPSDSMRRIACGCALVA